MSILLETTLGDITIDFWIKECPENSKNFIKLCKRKYFNNIFFWNIKKNFLVRLKHPKKSPTTIYKFFKKRNGRRQIYNFRKL